ncbi:DUF2637 domain-containing protein [Streptomyces flaveus]|uniref:DUF2637 domain-containing protein n=1 Tax=Streptomyces flaveus TaxID=66370 RepID=UPI00331D8071
MPNPLRFLACKGHMAKPSKPLNESGVQPLTRWERFGATLTALGGAAVGALGFYASFDAVSAAAETWNFIEPWVLPVAIDSAIPVFTAANLYLIRMDMALAWVRFVPWVLSLITCALNVAAGHSLWAKVAHGSMSLLWVGVSEVAAHIYAVRIGAATGRRRRLDKVRLSRWLLSSWPTFLLWRRMKLWEMESYDTVLKLEQERLVYQAKLRGKFGRGWRRKAPIEALLPLRLARNGIPLADTAPAGLAAAGIDPFDLPVLPAAAALESPPAVLAAPAAAAVRKPWATATVPAQTEAPVTAPEPPEPAMVPVEDHVDDADAPVPITEDELYAVVVAALESGDLDRFRQGGDLTGSAIGRALGQTPQNGRKVRNRMLTRYAAHLGDQGIAVPENCTVEDLATPVTV